ncbi:hypothetical protein CWB73_14390 [Pseudoalteromonas phenolica]|uniref:Potassium transporter Trk n=1 Tax=Pseudoalteromonas phenolica TaxID=161398 RepID=A0A5S3YSE4_9GAMM|nr:NAD(P)-binding domain-containing protein [Pseudoalteromonas phenolica]TMP79300.1 hypothetical protein CWB73_14390 [Pseudoalteromonas phenolica]
MKLSTDVLIIGAGHMGLVLGHYLQARNVDFQIVEAHNKVGEQWRKRYQGLSLFTPNSLNKLPNFHQPSSKNTYLTKDEFADYLAEFAKYADLPLSINCKVIGITYDDAIGFRIKTTKGEVKAKTVVLATGAFSTPLRLSDKQTRFQQLYLNELESMAFRNKHIMVAGDGASGRQIAKTLSQHNKVYLAQGKQRFLFSQSVLGISTFWLLKLFGFLRIPKQFKLANWLKHRDPFPDTGINDKKLRQLGVQLVSRVSAVEYNQVVLDDGNCINPDILISAIGYQQGYDIIQIPEIKTDCKTLDVALSEQMGLFQIGQPWQHNRASGLIYGADYESKKLLRKLGLT